MTPCWVMHSVMYAVCHIGILKHYQTHIDILGYNFPPFFTLNFTFTQQLIPSYTPAFSFVIVRYTNMHIWFWIHYLYCNFMYGCYEFLKWQFFAPSQTLFISDFSLYFIKIWKMSIKISIQMFLQTSSLELFEVLSSERRVSFSKQWTSTFLVVCTCHPVGYHAL